jgi:outer membrane receptor protein involved in Fe transport
MQKAHLKSASCRFALISWFALSISGAAAAADQPTVPDRLEGTEIVVTAQGREQSLSDVPVAVSVVSGDALRDANITSVSDLAARLPNVRITVSTQGNQLHIRGVGSGFNQGFEQAVGTFVDGIYRGRSRAIQSSLFDIERIEVLKGPQSIFFGANTSAGALSITTRKPGNEFALNASVLYAPADGEFAIEGGMTLPVSDTLSVRVAAKGFGMDGYVSNTYLGKTEPHNRDFITRGSIRWAPSSSFESDNRIDYGRNRDRGYVPVEVLNCPPPAGYGAARGFCGRYIALGQPVDDKLNYKSAHSGSFSAYNFAEASSKNVLHLEGFDISSQTGYFWHDTRNYNNSTPVPVLGTGGTASGLVINPFEKFRQFSQEVRLISTSDGPVQFMLGGYYAKSKLKLDSYVGFYFGGFGAFATAADPSYTATTPIASYGFSREDVRTLSGFGSAKIKVAEPLTVNLGLRYSDMRKVVSTRDFIYGKGGFIPAATNYVAGNAGVNAALRAVLGGRGGNFPNPKRKDNKLLPSASVQYDLTPDIMTYASYSEGFKGGGYGANTALPFEFGPESVKAYELGIKGTVLDRSLFFSLALYRQDFANLQESTNVVLQSGSTLAQINNVAKARSQGIEFATIWRLNDNVSFNTDIAYSDSKYVDYASAPCTILGIIQGGSNCIQDLSGKRRGYAPKFSGNFGLSLKMPLGDAHEVRFDPNAYFASRHFQSATADPLLEQKGYIKFDARLSVGEADGGWEFAIIGKNLTDKATGAARFGMISANGSTFVLPERPRSIAFQFSIRR